MHNWSIKQRRRSLTVITINIYHFFKVHEILGEAWMNEWLNERKFFFYLAYLPTFSYFSWQFLMWHCHDWHVWDLIFSHNQHSHNCGDIISVSRPFLLPLTSYSFALNHHWLNQFQALINYWNSKTGVHVLHVLYVCMAEHTWSRWTDHHHVVIEVCTSLHLNQ